MRERCVPKTLLAAANIPKAAGIVHSKMLRARAQTKAALAYLLLAPHSDKKTAATRIARTG